MFIFIDCFKIVQKARKVLFADAHMCQKDQALVRRRAECTSSDQSLLFLPLHKPGFRRCRHICASLSRRGQIQELCDNIQCPPKQGTK